jgi:hypothetical protein
MGLRLTMKVLDQCPPELDFGSFAFISRPSSTTFSKREGVTVANEDFSKISQSGKLKLLP